ncbi:unnamed protein product [Leptidea sinapis]|uniref:Secreted protein n=1 Tax=Leptidea sinapis TaxID=189913 RepID=A0A5E4QDI7_9NEOP|nr:unnamed protein product [Leptidea sinapis]
MAASRIKLMMLGLCLGRARCRQWLAYLATLKTKRSSRICWNLPRSHTKRNCGTAPTISSTRNLPTRRLLWLISLQDTGSCVRLVGPSKCSPRRT